MKKILQSIIVVLTFVSAAQSQAVTRLSNNTSYDWGFPIASSKILLRSDITKNIWVYDIAGASFTQLSSTVTVDEGAPVSFFNGKVYFAGKSVAEGKELWVTDGTPGGTSLVKDINTTGDSNPMYGFIVYNTELYFTASDGVNGRELWKTDGSGIGTVMVKNINPGAADAFNSTTISDFKVINGVLVFSATTAADGDELWKTDGTDVGTIELKNIYTTATLGSHISNFTEFGGNLIFTAYDEVNGQALWKTDGTALGTVFIKDIDPTAPLPPPFYYLSFSVFPGFFNFQNQLYFAGNDGSTGFELWKTDGTTGGTVMIKDIDPGPGNGTPLVIDAVKTSTKFFFPATTAAEGTELWQSDGTTGGTSLLVDVDPGANSGDVIILPDYANGGLFLGNRFIFSAKKTGVSGQELYISDGTVGGTSLLKDINPGPGDGYDGTDPSFFFTNNQFFFIGNDGVHGNELWQSDGTGSGTSLVADVNATAPGAGSNISFTTVVSGTLYFFGTDGDDPTNTDFFKLNTPVSLPLIWQSVEARPSNDDIVILWETGAEELTDYFTIQRSENGSVYEDIGKVNAKGVGSNSYLFTDAGAMKAGVKKWYYRVRYVDKDAKSALSRVVTVTLNKLIASIQVLPNPAANEIKLDIEAVKNERAMIRILDANGKTVSQRMVNINKGRNSVSEDGSRLANGSYIIQVVIEGSITNERFLIQR